MTALHYHQLTKHSPQSVRSGHFLDWDNQPLPFKIYPDLDPIPLPRETQRSPHICLASLAHLLYFSAGITKRRKYPGGEILFRAAACTGALYEIELYVLTAGFEDLPAGLYHYNPGDLALRRLRAWDQPLPCPLYVFSTGTYWRNAWKYQDRTYRHFGWDNGTMLANLLAVAEAMGWPAQVLLGFADRDINHLLGLDTEKEVGLSIVALGGAPELPTVPPDLPALQFATVPLSRHEVDYPLMREVHACTVLETHEQIQQWRRTPSKT